MMNYHPESKFYSPHSAKIDYKVLFIIIGLCGAIVLLPAAALAQSVEDTGIDMVFNNRSVSTNLQNISLRLILEKLKKAEGISYTGEESLLEKKISIRFNNLPLESAMERIMSRINHVFFYDRNKRLVGILILGEKSNGFKYPSHSSIDVENVFQSKGKEKDSSLRGLFELPAEPLFPNDNSLKNIDATLKNTDATLKGDIFSINKSQTANKE